MDLILVALLWFSAIRQAPLIERPIPQKSLVGNIQNSRIPDGCGCYFRFRHISPDAEKYIFFSSVEENAEKEAWMNLDGRDTKLELVWKKDGNRRERIGNRSSRKYAAGGIVVNAVYVITAVCRRNDENCESTDYAATFTVKKGKRTQIVKAIGGCGC